jgi:type III secretion system FlhB-like substrate exporter
MESALLEKAELYQTAIIEKAEEFVTQFVEAKEQEIQAFQEGLIEKLDQYLDLELDKSIPKDFTEAVAKVSIYEPIVYDMMESVKKNYVKCDTESFGLLKEAHSEITSLREKLSAQTKNLMELNSKHKEVERSMKISKVCEGLSTAQMERAQKLLEGVDVDQIDTKFEIIRDIVLEDVKPSYKTVVSESASASSYGGYENVTKVVSEETSEEERFDESVSSSSVKSVISEEQSRIMNYAADYKKRWGRS